MTDPSTPDSSWVIVGHGDGLMCGPRRAIDSDSDARAVVALRDPIPFEDAPTIEIDVAESGLRSFTVSWYELGTTTVAVNPAGGNQVSWDLSGQPWRVGFTPAKDGHLTAVHQRFVLRHFTTLLLESDLGGRSIHAVTGRLSGREDVVVVAGPTQSGKTRLMNRLITSGVVDEVVDDDCPVLLDGGRVATLVPRRYEMQRAVINRIGALVLLDDIERTPVPWPASWLPSGPRPALPALPDGLITLRATPRDDAAHPQVAEELRAALSARR